MALSTIVKISSINNLSDARYCAGMGVDFMGFCIDKTNPCFISPLQFKEITGWISGVKTVAEIENTPSQEVLDNLEAYKVNYFEVGNESALDQLGATGEHFIYKINVEGISTAPVRDSIHFYLTDAGKTKISKDDLFLIKDFSQKHSVIVSCGEDKELVKELITKTKIKGIELKGGQEIKPGLKDYDSLSDILEMLEID